MEDLERIYNDAGRPGARVLRTAARRNNLQITSREAQDFVRQQTSTQVLGKRSISDGKVTAFREESRWMMDLLDFSRRRAQPGGHKYLLTVIDIFSRFLWVERLTDRTDVQVDNHRCCRHSGNIVSTECLPVEKNYYSVNAE